MCICKARASGGQLAADKLKQAAVSVFDGNTSDSKTFLDAHLTLLSVTPTFEIATTPSEKQKRALELINLIKP